MTVTADALSSTSTWFCFVPGNVDLPDAHSDAKWRRAEHNKSLDDEAHFKEEKVSRFVFFLTRYFSNIYIHFYTTTSNKYQLFNFSSI